MADQIHTSDLLLSEVHLETLTSPGQSIWHTEYVIRDEPDTGVGGNTVVVDQDGDLVLSRRRPDSDTVTIQHHLATPLPGVGLQIWQGALLLADYLLAASRELEGKTVVELGCGTGLAGIVAARYAKEVFLTDLNAPILQNCQRNVDANAHSFAGVAKVRALDWTRDLLKRDQGIGAAVSTSSGDDPFAWSSDDAAELDKAELTIGADLVYDDELSEALLQCIIRLLRPRGTDKGRRRMILALEKRYNFTIRDLDAVAPAYDYFASLLAACAYLTVICLDVEEVPQRLQYDRGSDLALLELTWAG